MVESQNQASVAERRRLQSELPDCDPGSSEPQTRSQRTAVLASLWTTAAGFGLVALGARIDERQTWGTGLIASGLVAIAIGPTVGHIYSGKPWSAGLGLRIAGVASAAVGVGLALRCFGGCSKQDETAAGVAFFGGATMFGIGTVYEIFTAGDSLPHRPRVGISVIQTTRGSGVGVSGRFW